MHHTAVTCYIPASLTRRRVPALFILAMPLRSPGPHPAKRQAHRLLRTVCQTLLLLTFPVIDGRASPDPLPHGFAFSILSETSFFYLPHGGCRERVNLSGVRGLFPCRDLRTMRGRGAWDQLGHEDSDATVTGSLL